MELVHSNSKINRAGKLIRCTLTRVAKDLVHFLLVFDHDRGQLIEQDNFGDNAEEAVAAYTRCEEMYRGRERIEVVLIASDSLETIKDTHANYFDGSIAHRSRFLTGLG